jgi:hypothetical protein
MHAAHAYLRIKPAHPAMEFEIRRPKRPVSPIAVAWIESDAVVVPHRVF